jgi:hypothetical protein
MGDGSDMLEESCYGIAINAQGRLCLEGRDGSHIYISEDIEERFAHMISGYETFKDYSFELSPSVSLILEVNDGLRFVVSDEDEKEMVRIALEGICQKN